MFKAVIYDMDGVLIDSEPLWRQSEMTVLRSLGVPLTEEMCLQTLGLRIDEAVHHWFIRYPWKSPSEEEVMNQIEQVCVKFILERGEPKAGLKESTDLFRSLGMRFALATSSSYLVIDAVIQRLELQDTFEVLHSAVDESAGKPHPAVYLTTVRKLGLTPPECLAIEDSPNGVLSAQSAGIPCIWIPEHEFLSKVAPASLTLKSLSEITREDIARLAA